MTDLVATTIWMKKDERKNAKRKAERKDLSLSQYVRKLLREDDE